MISLGRYPEISLREARERRDEARRLVAKGIDPSAQRKAEKASKTNFGKNSFEVVAREYIERKKMSWKESHARVVLQRLENDVFPFIGKRLVETITPTDIRDILTRIEQRAALETAHRILNSCSQVFRHAVVSGRIPSDPCRDLRGFLHSRKPSHLPAIVDPKEFAELLRKIDGYRGHRVVERALRLAPLVFVRPGELRTAQWADIDFQAREWRYTVPKTSSQHIVPLATQAISILEEMQALTSDCKWVFPSARSWDRPMSENGILAALRAMDVPKEKMCGHGFRATARTLLDEVLGFQPHLIEHQLAHLVRDPLGRSYNRTKHLPDRHVMMQAWADYLDKIKVELKD